MNPRPLRADRRPATRRPAVTRISIVVFLLLGLGGARAGADEVVPAPAQASNTSSTIQVIWQVQRGCMTYCTGTSLTQSAVQVAVTTQTAQAEGGTAVATNQSTTLQLVWQIQLGCVAYCFGTTQTQTATQNAQTDQVATAVAQALALAANASDTTQLSFQLQIGCSLECYGTTDTQALDRTQATSSTARTGFSPADAAALLSQLRALASQVSATVQEIVQYQEGPCLTRCTGDVQVQVAVQNATTTQTTVAGAAPPPPPPRATRPLAAFRLPPGTNATRRPENLPRPRHWRRVRLDQEGTSR